MSNQQRYISDELTHFVGKGKKIDDQYEILLSILRDKRLLYSPTEKNTWNEHGVEFVYRYNENISDNKMVNPSMVCFCDIPVEDFSIHIQKYSPFGISFTKDFIVSKGGTPLFYIPRKATVPFAESSFKDDYFDKYCKELYHYFDDLLCKIKNPDEKKQAQQLHDLLFNNILSYVKFFDHALLEDHADNYYFEREWRVLGNLYFRLEDVQRIVMPKSYAEKFRDDFPRYYGQLSFVKMPLCQ